jgi:hypothetical protein
MSQPLLESLFLFLLKSHGQRIHHNVGASLGSHGGQGIDPVDPFGTFRNFLGRVSRNALIANLDAIRRHTESEDSGFESRAGFHLTCSLEARDGRNRLRPS